jgi:DNA-directed RNA polymerase subunit RPC12/RpoP
VTRMLTQSSKQAILRKLEAGVGYPIREENISQETRQAIANLAVVQKNLYVMSEILRGEQGRVERSRLLSLSAKLQKDNDKAEYAADVKGLQGEINAKIAEISNQILSEDKARLAGQPVPARQGGIQLAELKCPNCSAALPMPTGRFVECQYCKSTISIQDVGPQIKALIQGI